MRRSLVEVNACQLRFSEPKTALGRRSVRLDTPTVTALSYHRRPQSDERLAAGLGGRAELVFARPDGAAL